MRWTDGSVYRGTWHKGIQHGLGIMLFPGGDRRCGLFMQNIFKEETRVISQYDEWFEAFTSEDPDGSASVPQTFRNEVLEYIQD